MGRIAPTFIALNLDGEPAFRQETIVVRKNREETLS
jgi:hypothetical protein